MMGLTPCEKFMIYARLSLNCYLRSEERLTITLFYMNLGVRVDIEN